MKWLKEEKIATIIIFIILAIVIFWWLIQPSYPSLEESLCQPDYMGGCW